MGFTEALSTIKKPTFDGVVTTGCHALMDATFNSLASSYTGHIFQYIPAISYGSLSSSPLILGGVISHLSESLINTLSKTECHWLHFVINLNDPEMFLKNETTLLIYKHGYIKDSKRQVAMKLLGQFIVTTLTSLTVLTVISTIFASALSIGVVTQSALFLGGMVFVAKKTYDVAIYLLTLSTSFPFVIVSR